MEGEPGDQVVATTVDDPTSLYRRAYPGAVRLAAREANEVPGE